MIETCAATLAALSLNCSDTSHTLQTDHAVVGELAPATWISWLATSGRRESQASKRLDLIWFFRPQDCLRCQGVTLQLRHLLADTTVNYDIYAVSTGHQAGIVSEFFQRERLTEIAVISASFRNKDSVLNGIPLPFLAILRNDTLVRAYPTGRRRLDVKLAAVLKGLAEHSSTTN